MQLQIKNLLSNRSRIYILCEFAFLAGIFIFCAYWAHLLPLDAGPDEKCAMIFPCTSTNTADSPTAVTLPYEIPYGEPPTRFFLYYPT